MCVVWAPDYKQCECFEYIIGHFSLAFVWIPDTQKHSFTRLCVYTSFHCTLMLEHLMFFLNSFFWALCGNIIIVRNLYEAMKVGCTFGKGILICFKFQVELFTFGSWMFNVKAVINLLIFGQCKVFLERMEYETKLFIKYSKPYLETIWNINLVYHRDFFGNYFKNLIFQIVLLSKKNMSRLISNKTLFSIISCKQFRKSSNSSNFPFVKKPP